MQKRISILLVFIFLLYNSTNSQAANNKRINIVKAYNESLETHISGTEKTAPPYITVIRSKEGLIHLFKSLKQIKNYHTYKKIHRLKKALLKTDFSKNMLIAVLTVPTDNYYMKFNGLFNIKGDFIKLHISYLHNDDIAYKVTPKKSIYYKILVINRSSLPVVLEATHSKSNKKKKKKSRRTKHIYGKLFAGQNGEIRLVSSKTRKGRIYYLSGDILDVLKKHIGKKITISGKISETHDGPYETHFKAEKIIKIYE